MTRRSAYTFLLALALQLAACSDAPDEPADAGTERDAGPRAERDSGPPPADAGRTDAGPAPADGGAGDGGTPDGGPFAPSTVPVPPLPPPIPPSAPTDGSGRPILVDTGTSRVVLDPAHTAGPVDVVGECLALVLACRMGGHSVDDCLYSAPRCTSDAPWDEPDCCPAACWPAYETLRVAGTPPVDALHTVVTGTPSCVPGLDALLAGGGS